MDNEDNISKFTRFVRQGMAQGMTRRAFLKRGAQLGLSLPAILGVLTACARERMAGPATPAAPAVPTAIIAQREPLANPSATPGTTHMPLVTKEQPTATATARPTNTPQPTATATPELPTQTMFAVIGDFGLAGEAEEAVAALVKSWQPAFVVTTGDNNYDAGLATTIDPNIGQYYHEFIGDYKGNYGPGSPTNRFFPVLGNHDWQGGSIQPYLDYFSLPGNERYYTFDAGPARFFMIDSMPGEPDGITSDSVQGQWLKSELVASDARWKIVVFHHPPFSSGFHGSSDWMQWAFKEWGAHLVLSGHDHDYERIVRNGLTYIVNGLGGAARYTPGLNPVEGSQLFFNTDHGAMLVTMDETQLTGQFVTRSGQVADTFTLT